MRFEDKVQDVEVTITGAAIALGCNFDGARYHVWLDTKNALVPMEPLYKNPPLGVERGSPGFFLTTRGSIASKFGRRLVDVMVERMRRDDLLTKAETREQEKEAERWAILEAARIKGMKERAAEAMYDALVILIAAAEGKGNAWEAIAAANAALAKAGGPVEIGA